MEPDDELGLIHAWSDRAKANRLCGAPAGDGDVDPYGIAPITCVDCLRILGDLWTYVPSENQTMKGTRK